MLSIIKAVSKKVKHPQTQKDVKREAKVTLNFADPRAEGWIEDALSICGGNSELAARVWNFGLYRFCQQQETNNLGKVDDLSKNVAKIIDGYVNALGISVEDARKMVMSNPDLVAKVATAKFEQFVEVKIEDFLSYASKVDDKGASTLRFPDVTQVDEEEEEEKKEEETK